jgi:RNA polymerase sigma-70 factor (ECF subfamily)
VTEQPPSEARAETTRAASANAERCPVMVLRAPALAIRLREAPFTPPNDRVSWSDRPMAHTRVMPPGDADLVARATAGDRSAEEAIYRRHAAYLIGMVTRLLTSSSDAEDAVQDTFVIAFEQMPRLRNPAALRPWLAQIAVSQVRRRLRKRRLLRLLGLDRFDEASLASLVAPDAGPDVRADLATIERVLTTIPVDQRIAWSLRYVEGETLENVARTCGCSLATVKRRLSAAHEKVRAAAIDFDEDAIPLRPAHARGRLEVGI